MTDTQIVGVRAWQALDSRGNPTVACAVRVAEGSQAVAMAPSGASTGRHEAKELRDNDFPYDGMGVLHAVRHINDVLEPAVTGADVADLAGLDNRLLALDGTADLSRLGANAVLAVSLAGALAHAAATRRPLYRVLAGPGAVTLPLPMVNILSGGAHAARVLDFQDYLVVPVGATSFAEAIDWCARVRRAAVARADKEGLDPSLVADEGGLGLPLGTNRRAVEFLSRSIEDSGLAPGTEAAIALDVAATQLYRGSHYALACEDRRLDAGELVAELASWCDDHPIVSIEDPLAEDDWQGWKQMMAVLGHRVQIVGDDHFVTHSERLQRGIDEHTANAILVKVNQRGTVSQSQAVLQQAQTAGFATIVSARSGETEDSWLSDLAVGWAAGQIKVGSVMRSERTAKWNRLLEIESDPEVTTVFAGRTALAAAAR